MRIGIDVDDTLANTKELIIEYAIEYDKKHFRNEGIIHPEIYDLSGMFNWTKEEKKQFINDCMEEIASKVTIKDNAKEVLQKLKKEGHEIYIITYRTLKRYKDPYKTTEEWLIKNNIPYDKLIANSGPKGIVCKKNAIQLLIDDNLTHCYDVLNYNIKSFVFDSEYNKESDLPRVYTWNDIYEKLKRR